MRSNEQLRRGRRKVRWGRVFFLLGIMLVMVSAASGAAFFAYINYLDIHTSKVSIPTSSEPQTLTNRFNILLLGVDDGANEGQDSARRADTIIVASINPVDGTVNMLSIPRDSRVEIPGHGLDKLGHAYAYGGTDLAVKTVQKFLGVPIQRYVVINWQGFIQAMNLIGGVDLYVENDMDYEDPYANLKIHLTKGYQHLDGQKAGEYVRFRHDELGDIGRVQRQQKFLKAVDQQLLSVGTVMQLPALVTTARQYIDTDMDALTLLKVANTVKGFKDGSLHSELTPGDFGIIDGLSYWIPDKEKTQALVQTLFAPATRVPGGPAAKKN